MKARFVALSLLWMMVASFQAQAYTGVIRFQGAVYEEGCALGRADRVNFGEHGRLVTVSPGVVLEVNAQSRACGQPMVFSTSYQPISVGAGQERSAEKAIIIVSYL